MTDDDLRALLGDTYPDTTDDQREAIVRASDRIDARWPDEDDEDERREAMNGALEIVLSDTTDEAIARTAERARRDYLDAQARLTGAIIAGALRNPGEGDQPRAARLGVARDTVRKALGR